MSGPVIPPEAAFGPVIITAREIYDAVIRVSNQVSTMQIQLAQHTEEHVERDHQTNAWRSDHEKRMRALERARWPLPSIAVLSSVAAVVVALFIK